MGKKRQIQKQEEVRNRILDVARNIIAKEGMQGLSIRKITQAIDYSPAIIYHYFKDKNELIKSLVNEGYARILSSVRSVERNENEPEKEIKEIFMKYIKSALANSEEYKTFMLNDEPSVLEKTGLLEQGISQKSPTMQKLSTLLQQAIARGYFEPSDPELTAQILWTSTFGLTLKLIIEKDVPQEQLDRLLDQHFNVLFNGIMCRKEC